MSVEQTLAERGQRYGDFADHARLCQQLKFDMMNFDVTTRTEDSVTSRNPWTHLSDVQKQALEVIADKIARVLSGDPNYADNWHDIQGYAKLVEDRLPVGSEGFNSDLTAVFSPPQDVLRDEDEVAEARTSALAAVETALRDVYSSLPAKMQALEVEINSAEPAAQIDDESERQPAVQQNGNDGAVYEDPWYGAPEWARFKAQDADGTWYWFARKPKQRSVTWQSLSKYEYAYDGPHSDPNWRDTLIERTSG